MIGIPQQENTFGALAEIKKNLISPIYSVLLQEATCEGVQSNNRIDLEFR